MSITMSNDPTVRRLLPQSSQMSNFSFAPQTYHQPRETQKSTRPPSPPDAGFLINLTHFSVDYVFVDEHNRHKRLKGMYESLLITFACISRCLFPRSLN